MQTTEVSACGQPHETGAPGQGFMWMCVSHLQARYTFPFKSTGVGFGQKSCKNGRIALSWLNFCFLPSSKILLEAKVVTFFSSKNIHFRDSTIEWKGYWGLCRTQSGLLRVIECVLNGCWKEPKGWHHRRIRRFERRLHRLFSDSLNVVFGGANSLRLLRSQSIAPAVKTLSKSRGQELAGRFPPRTR